MATQTQKTRNSDDHRTGEILVKMGQMTEDQFKHALREQMHREKLGFQSSIGEICVENDWCTMRDIALAIQELENEVLYSSSLGQGLLQLGFIRQNELNRALTIHNDLFNGYW